MVEASRGMLPSDSIGTPSSGISLLENWERGGIGLFSQFAQRFLGSWRRDMLGHAERNCVSDPVS